MARHFSPKLRARILLLLLLALARIPDIRSTYHLRSRSGEPFRELAQALTSSDGASDLVLVHSIPSGVLGIARYFNGSAPMSSWVGQLGNRPVPESMQALARGRPCISFLKIHEVGEPAPEEDWLRANVVVVGESVWEPEILSNSVQTRRKRIDRFVNQTLAYF
jgi:hypothetical protein